MNEIFEIKHTLTKHIKQNILTKLKIDYLTNFSASTSSFYDLPKIRKSALILEAIAKQNNKYVEVLEPNDLKLQYIVAAPTCATWSLSYPLIHFLLNLCAKVG